MSKINVKTTFEASRILRPIYTGGGTSLDSKGRVLLTCVGEDALIVDLATGDQLASLEGVSTYPTPFAISQHAYLPLQDGELVTSLASTWNVVQSDG
jgi:U3 small nucleolar RNA-associated protein 13